MLTNAKFNSTMALTLPGVNPIYTPGPLYNPKGFAAR